MFHQHSLIWSPLIDWSWLTLTSTVSFERPKKKRNGKTAGIDPIIQIFFHEFSGFIQQTDVRAGNAGTIKHSLRWPHRQHIPIDCQSLPHRRTKVEKSPDFGCSGQLSCTDQMIGFGSSRQRFTWNQCVDLTELFPCKYSKILLVPSDY